MSAHKYWLITNIVNRVEFFIGGRTVNEIRFNTKSGAVSNNSAKGFSNSFSAYDTSQTGDKAFDGTDKIAHSTFSTEYNYDPSVAGLNWRIWYVFDEPQEVVDISLKMRPDMQPEWGQEWQKADIYTSDDGLIWRYYGFIEPKIAQMNTAFVQTPLYTPYNVVVSDTMRRYSSLDIYSVDESGSFSGLVTQGKSGEPKLPLKAEVLLYDRMTNELLQRTWSSDLGAYSFSGLDAGREYYAVTLHPDRTYNAAIQDGLKSGMTA